MMEVFKDNKVEAEVAYSSENLLNYSIKAKDPYCDNLEQSILEPGSESYLFNSGWLILNHSDDVKTLNIASAYYNPNGKVSSKAGWKNIIEYAKHLGCKKLSIYIDRNPGPYKRKYGFKTITRYMEKNL